MISVNADNFLKTCLPVLIGVSLRSSISLHSYSGESKPPMYGDYEAQRHWMEITTNLPCHEWYVNSTHNDLNYWGLDYPPVTAYHSWLMGKLAEKMNPDWVHLYTSRGFESKEHKLFMRYTVLVADLLFYIPSVLAYFYYVLPSIINNNNNTLQISGFHSACLMLTYPGLILIDHGHFQYNCVSLGLYLSAVNLFLLEWDILGSLLFCLALGYKQMELYHALPIFFYLLSNCIHKKSICNGLVHFVKLSFTVSLTIFLIFAPFLITNDSNLLYQVIRRLFPFDRGIYEDKVSNFWCATSPLVKWRRLFPTSPTSSFDKLVWFSILLVLIACLPSCLTLLKKSKKFKFLISLTVCALSFYLFSFQVHEKSILLVSIPALCLLPLYPKSSFLFSVCSTLSMWPLFRKDSLQLASLCLMCIHIILGCFIIFRCNSNDKRVVESRKIQDSTISNNRISIYAAICLLVGYGTLILGDLLITPPLEYPDLFPLLLSMYSFMSFFLFMIYWQWKIIFA
ncbi:Dolichyl pyrophosphate Man9GlcNAc2 alpha-1,3-glucosyltransferase [Schistosoma japonicum]|uniref:Alpha-1,3-glucosyltransferase n=1 Tax=Schistosoma japonicum TaxID=6182 RepID=A0A4Z2D1M0_SCHJA|nr:Dolichyl pyrophosphate Man9GlcNAc2 alpha-1,3-glucosyltransferase [Schistosoma japonicum]